MWTQGKVRANCMAWGSFFAPLFAGCGGSSIARRYAKAVAEGTLARLSRRPTALVSPHLENSHSVENTGLPAGPDYAPPCQPRPLHPSCHSLSKASARFCAGITRGRL
jgi:hypothetical protein